MPEEKVTTLAEMQTGQSGVVVQIQGGHGLVDRLNSLGIRSGKRITKTGSMIMRGPITIQAGNAHVAIGLGMARRLIVRLD